MHVEFRVHELDEVIQCKELSAHAGLVAEEIPFLAMEVSVYRS